MSDGLKQVLTSGDLSTRQGLDQAIKASSFLGKALTAGIFQILFYFLLIIDIGFICCYLLYYNLFVYFYI